MLRCPACGRMGGPFLAGPQAVVGRQVVRMWHCHCAQRFHAVSGAERTSGPHAVYTGFVLELDGHTQPVMLRHIARDHTLWQTGPFTLTAALGADEQGRWALTIGRQKESHALFQGAVAPSKGGADLAVRLQASGKVSTQEAAHLQRAFLRIAGQDH